MRNIDGLSTLRYFVPMKTTAELYKSMADETRLRILILLQGGREYCVCDLFHALDLPQSTVSRHLAYLKRNGWLQGRRGGIWMYYSLTQDMDPFLQAQLALLINRLVGSAVCRLDKDRLENYLRSKNVAECG